MQSAAPHAEILRLTVVFDGIQRHLLWAGEQSDVVVSPLDRLFGGFVAAKTAGAILSPNSAPTFD